MDRDASRLWAAMKRLFPENAAVRQVGDGALQVSWWDSMLRDFARPVLVEISPGLLQLMKRADWSRVAVELLVQRAAGELAHFAAAGEEPFYVWLDRVA